MLGVELSTGVSLCPLKTYWGRQNRGLRRSSGRAPAVTQRELAAVRQDKAVESIHHRNKGVYERSFPPFMFWVHPSQDNWLRSREPLGILRATPPVCWAAAGCSWSRACVQGSKGSTEPAVTVFGDTSCQHSSTTPPPPASPVSVPGFDHLRPPPSTPLTGVPINHF